MTSRPLHKAAIAATVVVGLSVGIIKPWEGYEELPYKDIVGVWTDCHGETQGVKPGVARGRAVCDALLVRRVAEDYYKPLTQCISSFVYLPKEVQAAGVSLAYNVGVSAVCKSSYAKLADSGRVKEACEAILLYNKARVKGRLQVVKGLDNRRKHEREVCLKGA